MAEAAIHPTHEVVSSEEEPLILVDESDREIGHLSKGACDVKRLWPLFWSNSCCSHPRRGETMELATERRLAQELGMTSDAHHLFTFQYQAPYLDLGSENEVCWVYLGRSADVPRPNDHEIADIRWITPDDLDREFETQPEIFTPWFAMEWPRVRTAFPEILGLPTGG